MKTIEELEKEIELHPENISWINISRYQKLTEEFIAKFQDKVYWINISAYQKLTEEFIAKFQDKVDWINISVYQKLTEEFIEKFQDKVDWTYISAYQKLTEEFLEKHNLKIPENSWINKDKEFKRKYILENTNYEIIDDKVIAYKSTRSDGYSAFNFQFFYEVGKEYEDHTDYNIDNDSSFGLSAWTKEGSLDYWNQGKLFKVEIDLEDIAAIVHDNKKIRATKIKIVEEVCFEFNSNNNN